ncbi:hypothetical protein PUN28_004249 [Cardiocondyla obscurior]|uniref:Uncharacterized protein n=1 Tax=Cardiocondyla obscurior TaxID=286306 RepID=A0AAW2GBQ3_9HYME
MDKRPKRTIIKPARYETTSSDQAPISKKRVTNMPHTTANRTDDDINEIRTILSSTDSNITNVTQAIQCPVPPIRTCRPDKRWAIQKVKKDILKAFPYCLLVKSKQLAAKCSNNGHLHRLRRVNYFHYIEGFNLKDAINLCLKEWLLDSFSAYDVSYPHFKRSQRTVFQQQMRDALKTLKMRHRHRQRNQRRSKTGPVIQRNLWSDDHDTTNAEKDLKKTDN